MISILTFGAQFEEQSEFFSFATEPRVLPLVMPLFIAVFNKTYDEIDNCMSVSFVRVAYFRDDICMQDWIEKQMFGFIGRARNRKQHLQKATDLTAVIQKMFTDLTFITGIDGWLTKCFQMSKISATGGPLFAGKKMHANSLYKDKRFLKHEKNELDAFKRETIAIRNANWF